MWRRLVHLPLSEHSGRYLVHLIGVFDLAVLTLLLLSLAARYPEFRRIHSALASTLR